MCGKLELEFRLRLLLLLLFRRPLNSCEWRKSLSVGSFANRKRAHTHADEREANELRAHRFAAAAKKQVDNQFCTRGMRVTFAGSHLQN